MIRSIKTIMRQDREPYRVPRRVQDVIPIQCVWPDGIFNLIPLHDNMVKCWKSYGVLSRQNKNIKTSK